MEDHIIIKKADDGSFVISSCECNEEGGGEGMMRIKMDEKTYTAKDSNELFEKLKEVLKIDGTEEYNTAFDEEMPVTDEFEEMPMDMEEEPMPEPAVEEMPPVPETKSEKPPKKETPKKEPPKEPKKEEEEEPPMSVGRSAFLASKDKKKKPFAAK